MFRTVQLLDSLQIRSRNPGIAIAAAHHFYFQMASGGDPKLHHT